ncbi:MAG: tripartite tricarboxylate transporter substrate binding protein [Pigmentiphaga sp.]|uniref:Bug family tripartite tricarboxylate transporter substrate binding protein n=1 Tax=Pigmentiphaga sp. TaxID=1977564 RepID=UPI0029B2251B|nr:tripartite tricarboxylate transporter substrate binding protein [Pigmentiphaga sp.]MDX3906640.1 tripartite tricarboxylate transporter substrate binding protein [Pigmentiphaga sp.]
MKPVLPARRPLTACLVAAACFHGSAAWAADAWPSRPIRVVVPYAPGNTGDITLRFAQLQLEKKFGVRLLIDNKSGASGNIGADEVVRAAPDGYTFLLGATNNFVTNQFLFKSMRFDPIKDLMPVSLVSNGPSVLVVNGASEIRTLSDLTEAAKKNPGKLNFGSPGNGTPPHLAAELYSQLADVQLTHVPYRGSPPAVQALMAGEIQLYITALSSVAGHVASGKLRAIAVADKERLPILPAVPTTAEQGLPGLVTGNWWGLAAPVGTDPRVVDKLAGALQEVLRDPAVRKQYTDIGVTPVASTPAEFAARIQHEARAWKTVIEKANIQQE